MKEILTVHEALCEAKVLEKRIRVATEKVFLTYNKASNTKIDGEDISVFKERAKSDYVSVTDLIKRFSAIKKAVSLSNAKTVITVCGVEMSVAEAIWQMQYGIKVKENLLNQLQYQYSKAVDKVNFENSQKYEERLERFLSSALSSGKDKASHEDIEKMTEVFKKQNVYELVDPINVKKEIENLTKEINEFKSKVDSCLQTSNATTTIEIEY